MFVQLIEVELFSFQSSSSRRVACDKWQKSFFAEISKQKVLSKLITHWIPLPRAVHFLETVLGGGGGSVDGKHCS